jgi:hypothetical protein
VRSDVTNARLWLKELRQWLLLAGNIWRTISANTESERNISQRNIEAILDELGFGDATTEVLE